MEIINQNRNELFKIRCEVCNSSFGYVRIKSNSWKCRSCNHEQKLQKLESKK